MARISFPLTAALICVTAPMLNADELDLIIVSGQSNSVGYNAVPEELPEDPRDKAVLFWFRCGDPPPDEFDTDGGDVWGPLRPQPRGNPMPKDRKVPRQYGNFAQASGGFGPEIGMARALVEEMPKLAVLKVAFSGTGLRKDWDPNDEEGAAGSCYRALISEFEEASAAAAEAGHTLRPRAFVWVQGESDANAKDAPHYADALTEMVASLREDIDAPELVALFAVNTRFQEGRNAFMPQIVEAQEEAAEADARASYVDTKDCTIANAAHFDTEGTLEMGRLFAEALLGLE